MIFSWFISYLKLCSINTPGVIERVKNLFKGYNKLILGFNTFLPDGEGTKLLSLSFRSHHLDTIGYKIELTAEEQGYTADGISNSTMSNSLLSPNNSNLSSAATGISSSLSDIGMNLGISAMTGVPILQNGVTMSTLSNPLLNNQPVVRPNSAMGITVPPNTNLPVAPNPLLLPGAATAFLGNNPSIVAPTVAPSNSVPNSLPAATGNTANPANPPQTGQMQQAHAIHYVTKIRNRFSNEPETYRSFLKILHTYQKEQKGIKEVLEQVSQLFADHPDLLMEFTYFLPDAVQDQAKERLERAARESELRRSNNANNMSGTNAKMNAQSHPGKKKNTAGGNMGGNVPGVPMGGSGALGLGGMTGLPANSYLLNPYFAGTNNPTMQGLSAGNKRSRNDVFGDPTNASFVHMASGVPRGYVQGMEEALNASVNPIGMQQGIYGPPSKRQAVNGAGQVGNNVGGSAAQRKQRNSRKDNNSAGLSNQGGAGNKANGLQMQQQQQQHYSVSTERKFFDQLKDVLLSISRDTWQEFVKLLELFSNSAISKDHMLDLVYDLLSSNNVTTELYHEFKRVLDYKNDYPYNSEGKEDYWYSLPLSEIDFTQCSKITDSYRQLPANFPRPKCSDRTEEEDKILNDYYVSIPIGSEESYSFKHMRKNQYEEALFKCEDERYEIDMIIDSNVSTIRALEPLAEEIAHFKALTRKNGVAGGNGRYSAQQLAPRLSLSLEKRQLSTIHLNCIARLYGDHGEEILELLRKNPGGTIPVILRRLKQKDVEWRKARVELSRHWKEIQEKNHYKSFDHRSFYFRQSDKKYLSTKQLVQEIATFQHVQQHISNASQGKSEKSGGIALGGAQLQKDLHNVLSDIESAGIALNVSEEAQGLKGNMKPQMVLRYEHDHHSIHRDIYQIVCHAAESHLQPSSDRERLAALWRDLLRVFFNLPVHYLYADQPALTFSSGLNAQSHTQGAAWSVNTRVLTTYGSGVVVNYREKDDMYEIKLTSFGAKAFIRSNSIYGAEQLSTQALTAIGVTKSGQKGQDLIFNGLVQGSEHSKETEDLVKEPCKVFFGTQMCYVFLRLHHTLYVRLRAARKLAQEMTVSSSGSVPRIQNLDASIDTTESVSTSRVGSIHSYNQSAGAVYKHFLSQVFALVDGSIDNARFEDFCRHLLGNKSYILYTIDKIISQLMKHLQAMSNDENIMKLIGLFVYHHRHVPIQLSHHSIDAVLYRNHVTQILSNTMEDVFRMQLLCPVDNPKNESLTNACSEVAIMQLGVLSANNQLSIQDRLTAAFATSTAATNSSVSLEAVAQANAISATASAGSVGKLSSIKASTSSVVNNTSTVTAMDTDTDVGETINLKSASNAAVLSDNDNSDNENNSKILAADRSSSGRMDVDDDEDDEVYRINICYI
jgi:histone deacetylase complex regulatory component SIN3